MDKQVKIVLASGRDTETMKNISKELKIEDYFISGNGAIAFNIKEEKRIYKNFINKEKALDIIKLCKENSIFLNVYTDKKVITESIEYNVKVFNCENKYKNIKKRTNIEVVDDIYSYIYNQNLNISKIIICDGNKNIFNNIIQKVKKIKGIEILDVEHMSRKVIRDGINEYVLEYYYTEITNNGVNKWNAIKEIIKELNIKENETICIGDNINDLEMIKNSGVGIVMKNSALEKMKIADYTTEDNNSDGVAKAIYKFI